MKSRRKAVLRLAVIAIVAGGLWAAYLHFGLLPGRLLSEALHEIGRYSGKKVVCDKIIYLPFRGLTFERLRIHQPDGTPLFAAKRFSANVKLIPFFRDKKIVVDNLILDEPVYDLSLAPKKKKAGPPPKTVISGQIDVPVAGAGRTPNLREIASGPDIFLPENVYLEQIEIRGGRLTIREDDNKPPFETVHSIDVRMGFQRPPVVRFDGRVRVGRQTYATIDLLGQWDLKNDRYGFKLSVLGQQVPDWLRRLQQKNLVILQQGQYALKTQLVGAHDGDILFIGDAHLKDAELHVSTSRYNGYMRLHVQGALDKATKKFKDYQGSLEFTRVDAFDISPKIRELRELTGLSEFKPDLLTVKTLRGRYKDVLFDGSGTITFKEREIDGRVVSELTVAQLLRLLPKEDTAKLKDLRIEGRCQAVTKLSGSLKKGRKVETEHRLAIKDGSVKSPSRTIDWTDFSAEISSNKKGLKVHEARFKAKGLPYEISAYLPKQAGEAGWMDARSSRLRVRADYTMEGEEARIHKAKASMPGIEATFDGRLYDWGAMKLALRGNAEVKLEKALDGLPEKMAALKQLSGTFRGPFILTGPLADPMGFELKMDGSGERVNFGKLRFEDLEVQLRYKDRMLNVPYVHSKFYGGSAGSRLMFDLRRPNVFFDSKTYMNHVDLSKLGPDLATPMPRLKGDLVTQVTLRGILQDQGSWRGHGTMSVTEGWLFETTQFKAMGRLPLVRVEGLEKVSFKNAHALFQVRDKRISTRNLSLTSDTVILGLSGHMDFTGALDMTMQIQYSDDIFRGAEDTGGLAPFMVQKAAGMISDYQVLGTLKEPRYEKLR